MPASTAAIGFGVNLQRNNTGNSPLSWEDIGEILEINGPSLTRDAVDVTHSASTDRYREFVTGLRDAGELTATIALLPASAQGSKQRELLDDYESNSRVNYRLIFPDGATNFSFSGIITNLTHATPIDDRMTMALTIKISAKPTLAATLS